jgi:hypothetical protein
VTLSDPGLGTKVETKQACLPCADSKIFIVDHKIRVAAAGLAVAVGPQSLPRTASTGPKGVVLPLELTARTQPRDPSPRQLPTPKASATMQRK